MSGNCFHDRGTFSVLSFLCRGIRNELFWILFCEQLRLSRLRCISSSIVGQMILCADCSSRTLKDWPESRSWGCWRSAVDVGYIFSDKFLKKTRLVLTILSAWVTSSRALAFFGLRASSFGRQVLWKVDLDYLHINYRIEQDHFRENKINTQMFCIDPN